MLIHLASNKNASFYIIFVCIIFILLIPHLKDVTVILFISGMLSILLASLNVHLERLGAGPNLSLLIVMSILIAVILLLSFCIIPIFSDEFSQMSRLNDPSIISTNLKESITPGSGNHTIQLFIDQYCKLLHFLFNRTQTVLYDGSSLLIMIINIPVFVFLLLRDGSRLRKIFLRMLPNLYFEPIMQLIIDLKNSLSVWLKEQIIMILIVGLLTTTALYSLKIPFPLTLGFALGFSHLIPYFGSLIGAFMILTVVLFDSGSILIALTLLVALALIKLVYQLLFLSMKTVNMIKIHPIFLIVFLLIGTYVWGFIGLLFIMPFMTIFFIIIKQSIDTLSDYSLI